MTLILLGIVAFAGLVHAGFQLSVSVLSIMSGHALGRKTRHARLLRMTWAYVVGCGLFTAMLLASTILIMRIWVFSGTIPAFAWVLLSGGLIGLGAAVWSVYYRVGPGTTLWVPHGVAAYITKRAAKTQSSIEAFSLGMSTIILEFLFIVGPLIAASFLLYDAPAVVVTVGIGLYSLLSASSVALLAGLIGSGHSVSGIQRWRIANKRFLQFTSGAGLIALGSYLYVEYVLGGIGI